MRIFGIDPGSERTGYGCVESTGSGHVVLFAEDPFYRGMTRSTTRQFFNAIAFNGVF